MRPDFELVLFSVEPASVAAASAAGITAFIVDWETRGKRTRQAGRDTEVNANTAGDLRAVRASTKGTVICRINQEGPTTVAEIEEAIANGADEILLPMVREVPEVVRTLERIDGRCRLGILVETTSACSKARQLSRLPLSRVYVGLNDLAIDGGAANIFSALVDGTVDHVRDAFDVPFGVAGLTRPDRGSPLPCRLLIAAIARLGGQFAFLRRSFHRDVPAREYATQVPRILAALDTARRRSCSEVERDSRELERMLETGAISCPVT